MAGRDFGEVAERLRRSTVQCPSDNRARAAAQASSGRRMVSSSPTRMWRVPTAREWSCGMAASLKPS